MAHILAACLTPCHTVITMSQGLILTAQERQGLQCVSAVVNQVGNGYANICMSFTLSIVTKQDYDSTYEKDKHFGERAYSISSKVSEIQTEIMTNGPVEGAFRVYGDFPTYRSGEYV